MLDLKPCDSAAASMEEEEDPAAKWSQRLRFPISSRGTCSVIKKERRKVSARSLMADHVRVWAERKVADGADERECSLPFLTNAPKMVECRKCSRVIHPGDGVLCKVRGCQEVYHKGCMQHKVSIIKSKDFRCPQHACFLCKQIPQWRCVRCSIASHTKCAPWPPVVLMDHPRNAVCWKHHHDWRQEKKHADRTSSIEEAFIRLPLPYDQEEFSIGSILEDITENKTEPSPYIHIRRNLYLVKKKRDAEAGVGCSNCNAESTCKDNCECRGLSVSCSKACCCSDMCTNRPFRKEKKIKVVRTELCGWGVVALEAIEQGDFVIEYIGEVIDDALCAQRFWDMKDRGHQNFYLCEVGKDFTIDATFKGNLSRFLNHSCNPNCKLEKWQVDGETRVGVFASEHIEVGDPLTYDYRFEHFGPMVKCYCGAACCRGFLGSKRKVNAEGTSSENNIGDRLQRFFHTDVSWGCKRKRTSVTTSR